MVGTATPGDWVRSARYSAAPEVSADLRAALAELVGDDIEWLAELPASEEIQADRRRVHIGARLPSGWPPSAFAWFHSTNAGVDGLLGGRSWPSATLLTRTTGRMGRRIAEYLLSWMLVETQQSLAFTAQGQRRDWRRQPVRLLENDLAVVFGVGRIGGAVGQLLRSCGLRVLGVSRRGELVPGFDEVVDLAGALRRLGAAQWVISTLPLTDQTRGLFDQRLFDACDHACFMNVGRGATVDYSGIRAALASGRLRRAVLDVLPVEPPGAEDPWWSLPNTTITPHIAGVTADDDVLADFRRCREALLAGKRPGLAADPDAGY
ncbi:hypothetical protein GCM10023322_06320 [Rugosimonospora acidiphila]|uniref:D-isomer specific 2-hydroxyacid dehydrogenase NAD-binding domain-containing protein n=1 Tax=Rugosimonospora acidiphila TaxID=556531 RepID=A0ABP9RJT7_9ACTN